MKRGVFFGTSLAFLALCAVPLFAQIVIKEQQNYGRTETVPIDEFDAAQFEVMDPELKVNKSYSWTTTASRFITEGYPKTQYFLADGTGPDGVKEPYPLRTYKTEREQKQILGVETKFNRKADNWVEIAPVPVENPDGAPYYGIPLEGRVLQLDAWVWGTNYKYKLEAVVRDVNGHIYVLPAGTLDFQGWKNVVIPIPAYIKQEDRLRSSFKNIYFVGFRVRTNPSEYVDNFAVFFDHLQYTTYRNSNFYDGSELKFLNFDGAATPAAREAAQ
jgi:hypothetical protein